MQVKITSKRQVTFPARVLDAMGVGPGDRLSVEEVRHGLLLHPQRVDLTKLAPLERFASGKPPLDIQAFREQPHDPKLRD